MSTFGAGPILGELLYGNFHALSHTYLKRCRSDPTDPILHRF